MSDGDSATPDLPERASGEDNQWLTRSARSAPGATPWERAQTSVPPDTAGGNHTDGVTVADLIAKLAADQPTGTGGKRRRADPQDDEPAPESAAEITDPVDAVIFEPSAPGHAAHPDPGEPVTEVLNVASA